MSEILANFYMLSFRQAITKFATPQVFVGEPKFERESDTSLRESFFSRDVARINAWTIR